MGSEDSSVPAMQAVASAEEGPAEAPQEEQRQVVQQPAAFEAEPLQRRALDIREKALGLEHPDTATSLNNLAELYHLQGRYEVAEPLYKDDGHDSHKIRQNSNNRGTAIKRSVSCCQSPPTLSPFNT